MKRPKDDPYAFLRNNWYLENEMDFVQTALAGAPIVTSAGPGKVGWALRSEYAQAAAAVLAGKGHESAVYKLSGPPASYEEFAAALSQVLGKKVPVMQVENPAYRQSLVDARLPGFVADLFAGFAVEIRQGALDVTSEDMPRLLGRPVSPLPDALSLLVKQLGG